MEFTCLESGLREPGVKQERDSAENEDSAMIHQLNKSTSDDEGNIPMEDIKNEATSKDDNDDTHMLDNIECHNTQVLSYPECINKYDDMIDIENGTQILDDVKFDISEMLNNVGDGNASVSNVGRNPASSDEDMRTPRSGKRVKLNEDTESNLLKCSFSRSYFFEIYASVKGYTKEKHQQILSVLLENFDNLENIDISPLDKRVLNLCKSVTRYWKSVNSDKARLFSKYGDWFNQTECIELTRTEEQCTSKADIAQPSTSSSGRGRPRNDFSDLSERSKLDLTELSQVDDSAVSALLSSSKVSDTSTNISADEVLPLLEEAKLTKHQYLLIKNFVNSKLCSQVLPSYHSVLEAKKKCFPSNIVVTELKAEIEFQKDHRTTEIPRENGDDKRFFL